MRAWPRCEIAPYCHDNTAVWGISQVAEHQIVDSRPRSVIIMYLTLSMPFGVHLHTKYCMCLVYDKVSITRDNVILFAFNNRHLCAHLKHDELSGSALGCWFRVFTTKGQPRGGVEIGTCCKPTHVTSLSQSEGVLQRKLWSAGCVTSLTAVVCKHHSDKFCN